MVPDTFERAIAVQRGLRYDALREGDAREAARWAALVRPGHVEGDDLRWVCSAVPEVIRRDLDLALRHVSLDDRRDHVEAARDAILPVEFAATTGNAHRDPEAALRAIAEGLDLVDSLRTYGQDGAKVLARFIRRGLLPAIEARQEADLDAGGLMPA